jgi:type IV pilus assembly protein PilQ
MRSTSMVLCLVLLLNLSPGHTSGATAAPATSPKTISLDVQGTDVRDVLRLLAETGGVNILASGEVQGTITVRLVDVPWEQALEAVLKLTGLAQERQGNIILVAPAERFRSARQERVQAYQAEAQTEPKIIRVVPVNYASATQLKATLEKLLGACAIIAVDGRTNTLILSGTPSCLRVWEGAR